MKLPQLRVKDFLEHFSALEQSKKLVRVSGRVLGIREMGSRLKFADLYSDGHQVQVMLDGEELMMRGDIVQVDGVAQMQKNATIKCEKLRVLQECTARDLLPSRKTGLSDPHLRVEMRHVDLLYNSMNVFQTRSRIIKDLRERLHLEGFMEVETPILSKEAGGALAEPFVTRVSSNGEELFMRIAPELWLKRCIVGGMERVFEIGKVFRNEGVDKTHQPEFTMCEFYGAYTELEQVMQFVTDYISTNVMRLESVDRVDIVEEVERATNATGICEMSQNALLELVKTFEPTIYNTLPKHSLFDKLVAHYVEPKYQNGAVFLMNHPLYSSPLAREHPSRRGQAERFELFIKGMEVANGYVELADADEQLRRFEAQAEENGRPVSRGDREYVEVLRFGLPPTVGCGLGVDRLVMLATAQKSIKHVILYPH